MSGTEAHWTDEWSKHLDWAEGVRNFPYEDSVGKLTIGVGRNLDDVGLSGEEIRMLKKNDMQHVMRECLNLPYWDELNDARKMVVADMVFNLGMPRFKGFVYTNEALKRGDYIDAAAEMVDSKWYRQTGRRAIKLVDMMVSGSFDVPAV